MLTPFIKRAVAVCAVGCCLFAAGCGSDPGQPVSQTEADQQSKLTEQGLKNAPVADEASRQNQLTGGSNQGK